MRQQQNNYKNKNRQSHKSRMILSVYLTAGANCFEDLQIVDAVVFPTFVDVAKERGISLHRYE